jgi:small-conductance mechanosensitive channel
MNRVQQLIEKLDAALLAFGHEVTSVWVLIQVGVILLAAAVAIVAATLLQRRINIASHVAGWPPLLQRWLHLVMASSPTIVFVLIMAVARTTFVALTWPSHSYLIKVAGSLASAWVVIALVAGLIQNRFVYRVVAIFAWTAATVEILGLREPLRSALDSFGVVIGSLRVTPLLVVKTTVFLLLTLWLANTIGDALERRVRAIADLTPSVQVLVGKLIRVLLITFAILIVLSTVGIDFSALAFFSGAIGVGLGFGLQKIVSNLVSGFILLADKSIKPGDVISVGESFGWVESMGARYTAVVTRNGREFLIPNEDFVTQRVINWSYSNDEVRIDVEFGVSYGADPHKAIDCALEAVKTVKRVLPTPQPVCHLKAFGNSSLDFILRFWIRDPIDGLTNVRGQVLLALWDILKRESIEIPFPQRDINMRTPVQVEFAERIKSDAIKGGR